MLIDIRAPGRLRGRSAIDLTGVLGAVTEAVRDRDADPGRLRFLLDWVQYRESFREPVAGRAIGAADAPDSFEVAIDLRRRRELSSASVAAALDGTARAGRGYLEAWRTPAASCIWDFNSLYWKHLALWEQVTNHLYEEALPGGETAARDPAGARALIAGLYDEWDELARRGDLPETIYVVELGVGNGGQARVWLDELLAHDRRTGRDYYARLKYVLGDYSPHVLARARTAVAHHAEHVDSFVVDARRPAGALAFLRGKAFLVYISNVYDNLPTDEVALLDGRGYFVEVRAYLPGDAVDQIVAALGVEPLEVPELIERLVRLGPERLADSRPGLFPTPLDATVLWRSAWSALRLEERYVPLELGSYLIGPGLSGDLLGPLLSAHGDGRMHVSNGAATSFVDTLPLLHPRGSIVCHDIFVTDIGEYRTGFRGPGKYDGSVVNWVNGVVLSAVGRDRGYDVVFAPFAHRAGSNVVTLRARRKG